MQARLPALAVILSLALPGARAVHPPRVSAYLRTFDTDGDGRVSLAEYQAHMMRGFRAMDRNHDGIIEPDEQPPGPRRHAAISERQYRRNLAREFHRQDANHDGFLDARELASPPR